MSSLGADAADDDDDDDAALLEADDPVNGLIADAIRCSLRLLSVAATVFQLLDPRGPLRLRLTLAPLAFPLLRAAGIRWRIPVLRGPGTGPGFDDGTGRHGGRGAPRFGAESIFLKTAHQVGKALLEAVGQIGIARTHGDPQLAGLLYHAYLDLRGARLRHLKGDVFQRNGGGLGLGFRRPWGLRLPERRGRRGSRRR